MKLDDIIALAKSGYKVSDIKELLTLAEEKDNSVDQTTDDASAPNTDTPNTSDDAEDVVEDTIDYKKLYEQSQDQLKKAQALNRTAINAKSEKTNDDILADFARKFY